jgi:hypothetical protein
MNLILTQVRADASPLSINLAFADYLAPIGTKLGWDGFKLMLNRIAKKIAFKRYPFKPEEVKVTLVERPVLFDPIGLARLTFQLQLENFAAWEFTATVLQYDLLIGGQPVLTLEKPLSLKLKQLHRESISVQGYLTPGLVAAVHDAMHGAPETTACELRVKLPVHHLLGEHLVTQNYQTSLQVQARLA